MPNVIDSTVVASAYNTSGNGGRKLVRLDNGNLYSAMKNTTTCFIYKSTDNASTWSLFKSFPYTSVQDISLATDGIRIFDLISSNNSTILTRSWNEDGSNNTSVYIDTSQTALGNCSLAINEQGTELYTSWSSKNATYPNSFNIRYAKGTIGSDGGVTWGSVEQVSGQNSTSVQFINPTITLNKNNIVNIFCELTYNTLNGIMQFSKGINNAYFSILNSWGNQKVYDGTSYLQSSPSAIYVPQSVNGLPNGRIWVAWYGYNSTNSSYPSLYVAYSDDGGINWIYTLLFQGISTNYFAQPSLTANKNNEISIAVDHYINSTWDISTYKNINNSWDNGINKGTVGGRGASSLFDLNINFSEPLFVYKTNSKVGFYGSWFIPPSIPKGSNLGKKLTNDNIHSYTITKGEGTITSLVEKIDNTVINTYNNPVNLVRTVYTTEEQWNALSNSNHTLTIEVTDSNGEKVIENYTFEKVKQLSSKAKVRDIIQELQDMQMINGKSEFVNVLGLPYTVNDSPIDFATKTQGIKDKMANNLVSKGVSASNSESVDALADKFIGLGSKKSKSGVATSTPDRRLILSGLDFKPSLVFASSSNNNYSIGLVIGLGAITSNQCIFQSSGTFGVQTFSVMANGFDIYTPLANYNYTWIAYE